MTTIREKIVQAADQIVAEGLTPTNVLIRSRLGRGSYSTINAAMKEWRESQADTECVEFDGLALELEQAINLKKIGFLATRYARKEFEAQRQKQEEEVSRLQADLEMMLGKADELENALDLELENKQALSDQIATHRETIASLNERCELLFKHQKELIKERDSARNEKAAAEDRRIRAEERAERLKEDLDRTTEALTTLQTADTAAQTPEDLNERALTRLTDAEALLSRLVACEPPPNEALKEKLESLRRLLPEDSGDPPCE